MNLSDHTNNLQKIKISLIVPAYKSGGTIEKCLQSFVEQETNYPLEIILIDSSPDNSVENIIKNKFPSINYIHSRERLLPHAARTIGIKNATGNIFIFSDSDIYAPRNWVQQLISAYLQFGGVIVGSFETHTKDLLSWGIHISKLDVLLSGGASKPIDFCAAGNMLCARIDFDLSGGLVNNEMLGDMLIGWAFTKKGIPIYFFPDAVVDHHHVQGFYAFLRESYLRGLDFGRLRIQQFQWTKAKIMGHILLTLCGARFISAMKRKFINAIQARCALLFIITLPISGMGQLYWLAGETVAYGKAIMYLESIK